jgi:hypothetical protein
MAMPSAKVSTLFCTNRGSRSGAVAGTDRRVKPDGNHMLVWSLAYATEARECSDRPQCGIEFAPDSKLSAYELGAFVTCGHHSGRQASAFTPSASPGASGCVTACACRTDRLNAITPGPPADEGAHERASLDRDEHAIRGAHIGFDPPNMMRVSSGKECCSLLFLRVLFACY